MCKNLLCILISFFGLSLLAPHLLPSWLIASAALLAGMFGVFQAFGLPKPRYMFAAVAWAYGANAQILFLLLAVEAAGIVYFGAWLIALFLMSASALHRDRGLKQTWTLGVI